MMWAAIRPGSRPVSAKPCSTSVAHRLRGQRPDLDQIGLPEERPRDVGEHRPHQRGLRSGEDQPDLLHVGLQLGAQQAGGAFDAVDRRELVEDRHGGVAAPGLDQRIEQHVDHGDRVGTVGAAPGERQLEHARG